MKNQELSERQILKFVQDAEAEFANNVDNWIEKIEELEDEQRSQSRNKKVSLYRDAVGLSE